MTGEVDMNAAIAGLRKVRTRRRTVWILFGLFLPVLFLIGQLFGEKILMYSAFLYLSLYVAARGANAHCPVPPLWRAFPLTYVTRVLVSWKVRALPPSSRFV